MTEYMDIGQLLQTVHWRLLLQLQSADPEAQMSDSSMSPPLKQKVQIQIWADKIHHHHN